MGFARVAILVQVLTGAACAGGSPAAPSRADAAAPAPVAASAPVNRENAPPAAVEFTVLSQGLPADRARCGGVRFERDGAAFYAGRGCTVGGARGWNVAAIDRATGELLEPARNFDTWYSGTPAATAMIDFLNRQPSGALLLIAVGDEAGMNVGRSSGCPSNPPPGSVCCQRLGGEFDRLRRTLEQLGARELGRLCYWNSYAFIAIKGAGPQGEHLAKTADAIVRLTLRVNRRAGTHVGGQ